VCCKIVVVPGQPNQRKSAGTFVKKHTAAAFVCRLQEHMQCEPQEHSCSLCMQTTSAVFKCISQAAGLWHLLDYRLPVQTSNANASRPQEHSCSLRLLTTGADFKCISQAAGLWHLLRYRPPMHTSRAQLQPSHADYKCGLRMHKSSADFICRLQDFKCRLPANANLSADFKCICNETSRAQLQPSQADYKCGLQMQKSSCWPLASP
jgi:hypothetical protein